MDKKLLLGALRAAYNAGKAILPVYNEELSISYKDDSSPLTEADIRSNAVIKDLLRDEFPMLSEEGKLIAFEERKNWETFWLVDPLDGTKEFIKKNGEFTVNIALIHKGEPCMGVVYVPVTGKMYFGMEGLGSFSRVLDGNESIDDLESVLSDAVELKATDLPETYTIVASRSHMSPETEQFINDCKAKYGHVDLISSGSSLKLCLVAEGKAHVYPRLAPTMEWDTAAAQAVAKFAGCRVYDHTSGKDLVYNKENLLNPWFVVERAKID